MIKNTRLINLTALAAIISAAAWLGSCKSSSDPISADIKTSISDESSQQAQEDEIDDMSTNQLQLASQVTGRVQGSSDDRVACAKLSGIVGNNQGSIIINFDSTTTAPNGSGCTDKLGNIRKGKIQIQWSGGKWYQQGTSITISLTNYSINGVTITGQRTLTNITDSNHPFIIIWTVQASHVFTWPDKSTAQRTVSKTKTWDILAGTVSVGQFSGNVAVQGTNRESKTYTVAITKDLVYTAVCASENKIFIPVSGTQIFTLDNSAVVTFDFGAGTCDASVSVTYNGKTDIVTVSN